MITSPAGKAGVSAPTAVSSADPALTKKRDAQVRELVLRSVDVLSKSFNRITCNFLVHGAFNFVRETPHYLLPWPQMLDRAIRVMRMLLPEFGEALCAAAERVVVIQAKAGGHVPASYEPKGKVPPSTPDRAKRLDEVRKVIEDAGQTLGSEKNGQLCFRGAFLDAHIAGGFDKKWPEMLDAVVRNIRRSAFEFGLSLTVKVERGIIASAKKLGYVPDSYKPPHRFDIA